MLSRALRALWVERMHCIIRALAALIPGYAHIVPVGHSDGTKYKVQSTKYLDDGAKYKEQSYKGIGYMKYKIQETKYKIQETKYKIQETKYKIQETKC